MRQLLLTGVVLLAAATFVGQAGASHLRYSSISAQSIGGDSYTFTFSTGSAGCATIGNSLSVLQLAFGDSGTTTPSGLVSATQCVGLFQWQYGPASVDHTYPSNLHGQSVTASSNGSCRVSLQNTPFNCTMRSEVSFVVGTGDSTPTMSVPPVVYCKTGATCTFSVPASDADGDPVRWRMSTDSEMGGTANPAGMSVNSTTGLVTWDTSAAADGLWAANVTVEELDGTGAPKGKTAADFIVALGNYDAPTFVSPSPADGGTLAATVGQPFTLELKANAPATKTATFSALILPSWLTCPFGAAADPATVTCTGTPSSVGTSQLVLLATASDGPQSTRSYSVAVAAAPTVTTTTTATTTTVTTTTPAPTPPAPAPEPEPAPVPAPLVATPTLPATGFVAGDNLSIRVANPGDARVLVSTTPDLRSPVSIAVGADGTIHYPVPQGIEGTMELFVVRPEDGSVADLSFTVDTKAPTVISVEHVAAPKAPAASAPEQPRKFFQLKGVDGGSGIVSLQVSPREGKTWGWRSFVTRFSAPLRQKTVRVRIADAAGNVSAWFVVPVTRGR